MAMSEFDISNTRNTVLQKPKQNTPNRAMKNTIIGP